MLDMIERAIADGSMARADVKIAAFTLAGALNWPARCSTLLASLSAETLQSIRSLAKTEHLDGEPVSGSSFGSGQPEIG